MNEAEIELSNRKMRIDVLLADYHEMYNAIYNHANFLRTRENLFVLLSFGILPYTLAYNVSYSDLYIAALASIAIFTYYIHATENAIWVVSTMRLRIQDIEKQINSEISGGCLCYQSQFSSDELRQRVINDNNALGYLNPIRWLSWIGIYLPVRIARLVMFLTLIFLWIFRIVE